MVQESLSASRPKSTTGSKDAYAVKTGLAQMLKGGVIMDVINVDQVCIIGVNGNESITDCVLNQGSYCGRGWSSCRHGT
jgi:hypothetical protein